MHLTLIFSKLSHISKNRDLATVCLCQYIQRSFHRNRICIIAVINNKHVTQCDQICTSCNGFCMGDTLTDFLISQSHNTSDTCRCTRIVYIMYSRNRLMNLADFLREMQICIQSAKSFIFNGICGNLIWQICLFSSTVFYIIKYRFYAFYFLYGDQFIIVSVQHDMSVRL